MADLIELKGVNKTYGGAVPVTVLHGIDLTLAAGEFAALIGQSGSGKSTLLNLIGALDRPTAGEIRIAGSDLGRMDDDQLARFRNQALGFIFQFHYLLPEFTVLENVLIPYWMGGGRDKVQVPAYARELLARVGVGDQVDKKATALSGGQQQRVAIARSLINRPQLILADEPTGNLDTASSEAVFQLLQEINRELGTTFIIVTHDRLIAARCRRVMEIVDGRIVQDYTMDEEAACRWTDLKPPYCLNRLRQGDPGGQK